MTSHHDHHGHPDQHDLDAGAVGGVSSCGGHAASPDALDRASADDVAECPVMLGSMVIKAEAEEEGLYRDYQGQRYWLCCDACGPLFDADPHRYAAAPA